MSRRRYLSICASLLISERAAANVALFPHLSWRIWPFFLADSDNCLDDAHRKLVSWCQYGITPDSPHLSSCPGWRQHQGAITQPGTSTGHMVWTACWWRPGYWQEPSHTLYQQVSRKSMTTFSKYRGYTELLQLGRRKLIHRNVISLVRILTHWHWQGHCLSVSQYEQVMTIPTLATIPTYNIQHLLHTRVARNVLFLCFYSN